MQHRNSCQRCARWTAIAHMMQSRLGLPSLPIAVQAQHVGAPGDVATLQRLEALCSIEARGACERREVDLSVVCTPHQLCQQPMSDASLPASW